MKMYSAITPFALLLLGILLNASGAWSETGEAVLSVRNEGNTEAALPPERLPEDHSEALPKDAGWEKRFFDKSLSHYNFKKNQFRFSNGSGIPLKSPGILPGIELGVEMHSFEALQSMVPTESLSKSFKFQPDQPLLLSPSNLSPDYNGGFLRFIW